MVSWDERGAKGAEVCGGALPVANLSMCEVLKTARVNASSIAPPLDSARAIIIATQ